MGRRTRIAEGIYEDRHGLAACVKVGHIQREKRYPAGTPLRDIQQWRDSERVALRKQLEIGPHDRRPASGTLQHDGDRFLARKKGRVAFKADRAHLRAWYPALGQTPRRLITRATLEPIIQGMLLANVAPRTIRHRCRVLRELWRAVGGPKASSPTDGLSLPRIVDSAPVPVPLKTIRDVAKRLTEKGDPKDAARFAVLATTGQRPAQVMRAKPADVDLVRGIWFVRPAKDGTPVPLPMNDEMRAAWKAFKKADAWGAYDTGEFAERLRDYGWPKGIRPYQLRHTFAIDHLLHGADLGDVQGLLGHKQIQTTRTHYGPILLARLLKQTKRRTLGL